MVMGGDWNVILIAGLLILKDFRIGWMCGGFYPTGIVK